jgi:hypothetical protein
MLVYTFSADSQTSDSPGDRFSLRVRECPPGVTTGRTSAPTRWLKISHEQSDIQHQTTSRHRAATNPPQDHAILRVNTFSANPLADVQPRACRNLHLIMEPCRDLPPPNRNTFSADSLASDSPSVPLSSFCPRDHTHGAELQPRARSHSSSDDDKCSQHHAAIFPGRIGRSCRSTR